MSIRGQEQCWEIMTPLQQCVADLIKKEIIDPMLIRYGYDPKVADVKVEIKDRPHITLKDILKEKND